MAKKVVEQEKSLFEGVNLGGARAEGENFGEYKSRLKANKEILKLYNSLGRTKFKEMFPDGVKEAVEGMAEFVYNENYK